MNLTCQTISAVHVGAIVSIFCVLHYFLPDHIAVAVLFDIQGPINVSFVLSYVLNFVLLSRYHKKYNISLFSFRA